MGIFVYFHRKLFYTDYFNIYSFRNKNSEFRDFQIVESETVNQRICFTNFCGLYLMDFVT